MSERPEYLRAGQIARLMGISLRSVRRWIAAGIIASVKVGGARLVAKAELERLCSASATTVTESTKRGQVTQKIADSGYFGKS